LSDFQQKLKLILELRKNPLHTNVSLAKLFNKKSPNTIKNWIADLKNQGILRDSSEYEDPVLGLRHKTDVAAQIKYKELGLARVVYILTGINTKKNLYELVKRFEDHPYTYYQVSGFLNGPIIYVIFNVPYNAINILNHYIEFLRDHKHFFTEFFELVNPKAESTDDQVLKLFNSASIDTSFLNNLEESLNRSDLENNSKEYEFQNTGPPKLDKINLLLLRELTINGKISPSELVNYPEYSNLDRSTLARRLKSVQKDLISEFVLMYNRGFIGNEGVNLIWGKSSYNLHFKIRQFLTEGHFPYQSTFYFDNSKYLWYIFAPSIVNTSIAESLLPYVNSINLANLNTFTNKRYYFYPHNYDLVNGSWKIDEEYINPRL
jgi:DNA-binding Lrp family transcriptional regulator